MRACRLEAVEAGPSGLPGAVRVLLAHELSLDGDGCAQRITPLAAGPVAGCGGSLPPWDALRARAFVLEAGPDKARFGRVLELPEALRGLGLGTHILCALVRRAVALGFGGARVRSLHLVKAQDTPLRNAFYRRMGFCVTLYRDGSGWARAARLDQLRTLAHAAKIRSLGEPNQGGWAAGETLVDLPLAHECVFAATP